jgi:hypothetical protein
VTSPYKGGLRGSLYSCILRFRTRRGRVAACQENPGSMPFRTSSGTFGRRPAPHHGARNRRPDHLSGRDGSARLRGAPGGGDGRGRPGGLRLSALTEPPPPVGADGPSPARAHDGRPPGGVCGDLQPAPPPPRAPLPESVPVHRGGGGGAVPHGTDPVHSPQSAPRGARPGPPCPGTAIPGRGTVCSSGRPVTRGRPWRRSSASSGAGSGKPGTATGSSWGRVSARAAGRTSRVGACTAAPVAGRASAHSVEAGSGRPSTNGFWGAGPSWSRSWPRWRQRPPGHGGPLSASAPSQPPRLP